MVAGAFAPELWPVLGAGAVMLFLAAALLVLDFNHRLNRAFALFLILRGVLNGAGALSQEPAYAAFAERIAPYFHIALPFAALYFAWRYVARYGRSELRQRSPWWVPLALVGAMLLFELAYARDHALWSTPGRLEALSVFVTLKFLAYAAIALLLARDARAQPPGSRRGSTQLIALGFALSPAYLAVKSVGFTVLEVLGPAGQDVRLAEPGYLGARLTALLILATLAATAYQFRSPCPPRFLGTLGAALATGAAVAVAFAADPRGLGLSLDNASDGLWTLALPLLVTYALLRHEVFGLDLRVKRTIRYSTIAAAFVGVYFLTSEATEAVLSEAAGPWVGLAAAGLLTLVQSRLQRGAERVAEAVLPGVRAPAQMAAAERQALYLEQAAALWADGELTDKDRRVLAVARARLGLAEDVAARLEQEARASLAGGGASVTI